MGWSSRYYLAADTETGGLVATDSDLLTAGFALYNRRFEFLWSFEFAISLPLASYRVCKEAMAVNKLNLEQLSKFGLIDSQLKFENYLLCPEIQQEEQKKLLIMKSNLEKLRKERAEVILMCHNVQFDKPFLQIWFPWIFQLLSYRTIDTIGCALMVTDAGKLPVENVKLTTLSEHFNIPHKAHSALADAQVCMEVYRRLVELCKI